MQQLSRNPPFDDHKSLVMQKYDWKYFASFWLEWCIYAIFYLHIGDMIPLKEGRSVNSFGSLITQISVDVYKFTRFGQSRNGIVGSCSEWFIRELQFVLSL